MNEFDPKYLGPYKTRYLKRQVMSAIPVQNLICRANELFDISKDQLLEGVDLSTIDLDTNYDTSTFYALQQIYFNCTKYVSQIELAQLWSESGRPSKNWIFGDYILTAPTVREALSASIFVARWVFYPFKFKFSEYKNVAHLTIPLKLHLFPKYRLIEEIFVLNAAINTLEELGVSIEDANINAYFSIPDWRRTHGDIAAFEKCHMHFNQLSFGLRFDKSVLDLKPNLANERSHKTAKTIVHSLIRSVNLTEGDDTYLDKILDYTLLFSSKSIGNLKDLTIDKFANYQQVSTKTVGRKLKQQSDTTFKQVNLQIKMELASALLKTTNYTVTHIAELVGYDDRSNFSRAFTSSFGQSPTRYRSSDR